MIGRTIGNYLVSRKIGEGGMGAVYFAEHPRIGRRVAIKVLHPDLSKDPQIVARFFTEAKAANEIRNEHIIEILDFGELEDGTSYFIMEWLDGKSLSEAMVTQSKFPLERALHVTQGVGRALAAAHARGIVHRDLKPDNIFLVPRAEDPDFVKVLDFGIAKLMTGEPAQHYKTQTGAIMGTPYYMSPEQCRGNSKEIDHRSDIYALGVILYQMVIGQLPFNAEGLGELLLQHMTRPPTPPQALDPTIPASVDAAILHALEKDPQKRYARVEDMLVALGLQRPGASLTGVPQATMASYAGGAPPTPSQMGSIPPSALAQTTLSGMAAETVVRPRSGSRASRYLFGGLAVTAAALAAIVLLNRKPPTQQPEPRPVPGSAAALTPGPVARPVPPPAAPVVPPDERKAHIRIQVEPADAHVIIDTGELTKPVDADFPRDNMRHHLVVRSRGYRAESRWILFDGDQDLSIRLQKGSGTHVTREVSRALPAPAGAPVAPPPPAVTPTVAEPQPAKAEAKKQPAEPERPTYKGGKHELIKEYDPTR